MSTPDFLNLLSNQSFINYCLDRSPEDTDSWNNYITLHPEEREEIERMKQIVVATALAAKSVEVETQLEFLKSSIEEKEHHIRNRRKAWWMAAAAVCALLIGIRGFWQPTTTDTSRTPVIYTTEKAQKKKLLLQDGTTVVLNAGSELEIPTGYNDRQRTVYLKGEAFFDVASDSLRPFFVETDRIKLRVLGTAFNVKDYPEDKTAETALIRGSVELTEAENSLVVLLKPNQKYISQKRPPLAKDSGSEERLSGEVLPLKIDSAVSTREELHIVETSWTRDRLVFADEPLDDIAKKLERWYGVEIILTDAALGRKNYSASFEHEKLEDVLEALQFSNPFHYTYKNDTIMITR